MSINQNFSDEAPTLNLNFAQSKILDPRVTFSRVATTNSGSTTYTGSDGLIKTAVAGEPRFDHKLNTKSFTGTATTLTNTITLVKRSIQSYNFSGTGPTGQATTIFTALTGTNGGGQTGSGASFHVEVSPSTGYVNYVNIASDGSGYAPGDTITIPGTSIGGTSPENNIIVTVGSLANSGFAPGMVVTTTNSNVSIPANTIITSVSGTTITLSNNITVTGGPLNNVQFFASYGVQSLGLLIEQSRTNILTNSNDFTTWTKQVQTGFTAADHVGVTANTTETLSPDGTYNASKYYMIASGPNFFSLFTSASETLVANKIYTYSVFAKKASTSGTSTITLVVSSGANHSIVFNLDSGIVSSTSISATGSGITYMTGEIIPYPNGWYRCCFTFRFSANTTPQFKFDGLSGLSSAFYMWGAQIEKGTNAGSTQIDACYASSYISTGASSAKRNLDDAEITGSNFSNWYDNVDGGTLYCDFEIKGTDFDAYNRAWGLTSSNSSYEGTAIYQRGPTVPIWDMFVSRTALVRFTGTVTDGTLTITDVENATNLGLTAATLTVALTTANSNITIPSNTTISSVSGTTVTLTNSGPTNISVTGGPIKNVSFTASNSTSVITEFASNYNFASASTLVFRRSKSAIAFAPNDSICSLNGVLSSADTSVTMPSYDRLFLGKPMRFQNHSCLTISQLTFYPKRLSNNQLQTLTRLYGN